MSFPYVLRYNGKNAPLTRLLYIWFDYLSFPPPNGKKNWQELDGVFTLETKETVTRFQQRWSIPVPPSKYGEVRAREWQQLGIQVGYKAFDQRMYQCLYEGGQCPSSQEYTDFFKRIGGYGGNQLSGGINIYAPRFIQMYAEEFGGFDGWTLRGIGTFLDFMRADKNLTDVRHVAYMMATVYHETTGTWQPVDEKGKGAGRFYGKPESIECGGKSYTHVWYGRGYVQLTLAVNYKKFDDRMNLGCSIVANPDKVKEPNLAYKILSDGAAHGIYRGKKLSDFINGGVCDYYNARDVINADKSDPSAINGVSIGRLVEGYAKIFEAMIRVTMFR